MSNTTSNTTLDGILLDNLSYQYRYDQYNRLIEKKLPGKDWEYIVYDKADKPILTQDGNLRASKKWLFTKYDFLGRPVYTGDYTNTVQLKRAAIQTLANAVSTVVETKQAVNTINGTTIYYSNAAFPTATDINIYTINYYDDYNFDLDGSTAANAVSYGVTPITNAKGLATGAKVRVLDSSPVKWITNVAYYDAKGRAVCNYNKNNFLDITTTIKSQLDFGAKVLETTTTHQKGVSTPIIIVDTFTYDHVGRLLTQKQKINAQVQEFIANNNYNNLGQLMTKGVGGTISQSRLQTVNFGYNVRGWLKSINNVNAIGSNLFAFQINYNTPASGTALFNGNISQTFSKTANADTSLKNYTYAYDDLNRLTQAIDGSAINPGRYNEILSYDKNGNITNLTRLGHRDASATLFGNMDILTYTYTGNRLDKVEDSSGSTEGFNNRVNIPIEYTYDINGNMKTDANKAITAISYNHLNLPTSVTINGSIISYVYDAIGTKLRKTISTGGSTDYAGSFIYENNALVPKQFSHSEGYAVYNAGIFNYIYQYKDHLGNIRLSYQDKDNNGIVNNTEIVQENNYYAFGLLQKGYNTAVNGVDNKYKYNGKEFQDELGLNITAMDYRQYDNTSGRFNSIDALSELNYSNSPFIFSNNNPVFWSDPTGLVSQDFIKSLWNNSAAGSDTKWVNDGAGNFDKIGSNGFVNPDGEYSEGSAIGEMLPMVTISTKIGDSRNWDRIRGDAYLHGKYYESWRDKQRAKKWSDFGQGLQDTGDIISGVGYALTTSVIFAEVGVPLAALGNTISLSGTAISTTVSIQQAYKGNDVSKNSFKVAKAASVYIISEVAGHYLNKVPGLEPTLKNVDGEEVMNLGNQILQQNIGLKIMGIDRYIDAQIDKE